jgi:integrase
MSAHAEAYETLHRLSAAVCERGRCLRLGQRATRLRGRVKPSGSASFLVQYRTGQRKTRRYAFGKVGTLTPEEARAKARRMLAEVEEGGDPSAQRREARKAITVAELCERYLEAARAGLVTTRFKRPKRGSTVAFDGGRVARHIAPLLGNRLAGELTRADVQRMADEIAAGRTAAVIKTKPRGRAVVNRFLSKSELASLGRALRDHEGRWPMACAAIRLSALSGSGLRREEAVGLRRREIDFDGSCLRLGETKTGRSTRPIGTAAVEHLRALPRLQDEWLFPNRNGTGSADLKKSIAALFDAAGLADARSHDLRRTFASLAAEEGYGDATIAELLGHARRGVTARHYIRRPDAALIAAADRVAARIASMLDEGEAEVVELPRKVNHAPA